jgi:hypothetical protein
MNHVMVATGVRCVRVISVLHIIFSRVTNFQETLAESIPRSCFVISYHLTVQNRDAEAQIPLNAAF